jgi:hypothetical protein
MSNVCDRLENCVLCGYDAGKRFIFVALLVDAYLMIHMLGI